MFANALAHFIKSLISLCYNMLFITLFQSGSCTPIIHPSVMPAVAAARGSSTHANKRAPSMRARHRTRRLTDPSCARASKRILTTAGMFLHVSDLLHACIIHNVVALSIPPSN